MPSWEVEKKGFAWEQPMSINVFWDQMVPELQLLPYLLTSWCSSPTQGLSAEVSKQPKNPLAQFQSFSLNSTPCKSLYPRHQYNILSDVTLNADAGIRIWYRTASLEQESIFQQQKT